MRKEGKAEIIAELTEKLNANEVFYIADASGLSVPETNKFRGMCYDKGVEYKVYKNTLIKKALDKSERAGELDELEGVLKGFSGIMFSGETGNTPAKILKEFRKTKDKPLLKGATIHTDVYLGDEQIDPLSKLKSRQELIGDVISALQSPAKNVISGLKGSSGDKLAGILKTLSEKEG